MRQIMTENIDALIVYELSKSFGAKVRQTSLLIGISCDSFGRKARTKAGQSSRK